MDEQILKNFESEYSMEIRSSEISPEDFDRLGIPEESQRAEIYLRTVYGDEFFESQTEDDVNEDNKTVEKIKEEDLSLNKGLAGQMEKIETDEFNDILESVINRVGR